MLLLGQKKACLSKSTFGLWKCFDVITVPSKSYQDNSPQTIAPGQLPPAYSPRQLPPPPQ